MEWIKLSDQLPPFQEEIVLLSITGFTRLAHRYTPVRVQKLHDSIKKVTNRISKIYDERGLPHPNRLEMEWEYWCLLPTKPDRNNEKKNS